MNESPGGGELIPLEPPLTPRTPREQSQRTPSGGFKSPRARLALSPHLEHEEALPSSASRTPGPVREWVFRDDEVSTDTRSSSTEVASEAHESASSQEEESDRGKSSSLARVSSTRLNLASVEQYSEKGVGKGEKRRSPRGRSLEGGSVVRLRGIEVIVFRYDICVTV